MSTLEVVILSLIAGGFIVLLLVLSALLIWVALKARAIIAKFESDTQSFLSTYQASMTKLNVDISQLLITHKEEMALSIARINGEGLAQASKTIQISAGRIEKAAVAFGEMIRVLFTDRENLPENSLGAEEYDKPVTGEPSVTYANSEPLDESINPTNLG